MSNSLAVSCLSMTRLVKPARRIFDSQTKISSHNLISIIAEVRWWENFQDVLLSFNATANPSFHLNINSHSLHHFNAITVEKRGIRNITGNAPTPLLPFSKRYKKWKIDFNFYPVCPHDKTIRLEMHINLSLYTFTFTSPGPLKLKRKHSDLLLIQMESHSKRSNK